MKRRPIILIIILAAILLALCAAVYFLEQYENTIPENETARKVWQYAKDNGIAFSEYPQELIDLLEKNPETEKFVLEYPIAKDKNPVFDLSEYQNTETVPLFLQWDQRWGYVKYGEDVAGLTGCGPLCLSMAAFYLTGDSAMSPDNMIRFAEENGYYVPGSGSSWTLISEGGGKLGLTVTEIPLVKNRILQNLEAGIPVICAMGPGDFTSTGHFIVMVGTEDGLIRVNDPNSRANSGKLWAYEDICDQIRNLWTIEG